MFHFLLARIWVLYENLRYLLDDHRDGQKAEYKKMAKNGEVFSLNMFLVMDHLDLCMVTDVDAFDFASK